MIERSFHFYRRWISPLLHSLHGLSGACRFVPTCSEYAAAALQQHGLLRGSGLAFWRLLRCNPFARGGFDPVPGTYPGPVPGTYPAKALCPQVFAEVDPARHATVLPRESNVEDAVRERGTQALQRG